MKVTAVERPFTLMFHDSGHCYPLTSEEVQRILDREDIISATRNRVVLFATNSRKSRCTIAPATLGGGPAFIVER